MNPTKAQIARRERIRELGCRIDNHECQGYTTIQHCETKMGKRKDHDKIIALCWRHHLGDLGIDGKKISKREWQERYGSEQYHLEETKRILGEINA